MPSPNKNLKIATNRGDRTRKPGIILKSVSKTAMQAPALAGIFKKTLF